MVHTGTEREKQMENFAFSVIMAVYNTGSFLEEAVESLIHQTYGF